MKTVVKNLAIFTVNRHRVCKMLHM